MSGPSEMPGWLRAAFDAQAEQINNMSTAHATAVARLEERIASYEDLRAQAATPPASAQPPLPYTNETNTETRRTKPRLPNPEKFDGIDLNFFPQFEGSLRAKLQIDGDTIGQEREQVWYAFGRLSGKAGERIFPWMQFAEQRGCLTVAEFFTQLRVAFQDPRRRQKALGQINRTKQGSRQFGEFLNEFNRLILEAEGWGWDDVIKKGYLKAALSTKLITAMVGVREDDSYESYCHQLRMVSDQLDEVAELTAWRTKRRAALSPRAVQSTTEAGPSYDAMEWQPTQTVAIVAARTKGPRWAPPEEMERRRRLGLCFKCGRDDHLVRECRAKSPVPKRRIRTAPVHTNEEARVTPALGKKIETLKRAHSKDENDSSVSKDSGKE